LRIAAPSLNLAPALGGLSPVQWRDSDSDDLSYLMHHPRALHELKTGCAASGRQSSGSSWHQNHATFNFCLGGTFLADTNLKPNHARRPFAVAVSSRTSHSGTCRRCRDADPGAFVGGTSHRLLSTTKCARILRSNLPRHSAHFFDLLIRVCVF
jgi:hypothetical protein